MSLLLAAMLMSFPINELNAVNRECYDHQADRWLRFPFKDFLPNWVKQYCPNVRGLRALDIGSGNGVFAKWLQEAGFDVLCLDPSEEMVRRCRAKGLRTEQMTIQEFHEKALFDAVFAILSLIHVPKAQWPEQIEKIGALLPAGGMFYLAVIEGENEGYREQESGYPRFFADFQKQEVLDLFQSRFELLDVQRASGQAEYLVFAFRKKSNS